MSVHARLVGLPRRTKRGLIFALDVVLLLLSLFLASFLYSGTFLPGEPPILSLGMALVVVLGGGAVFQVLEVSRIKLHAFETQAISRLLQAALLSGGFLWPAAWYFAAQSPITLVTIFSMALFGSTVGMRLIILSVLNRLRGREGNRVSVMIYGAGNAGLQLASALRSASDTHVVGFFDDNPALHRMMIAGLPVYAPSRLEHFVARSRVDRILIAIPSASEARQRQIIEEVCEQDVEVRILPSLADLANGNSSTDQLRPISPEEFLGRDRVDLDIPEMAKAYAGRVVMVTGAGGSIGSELCRQLLSRGTARIVLFEQSEYALYTALRELEDLNSDPKVDIRAHLGSVTDRAAVARVIADENVHIVLHAAAYKHVSLVEDNVVEGVRNNVLGTRIVATEAEAAQVERFILVSTDKAVRPTSVMGASKRMAELVIQDLQSRSSVTKFAAVRFGNVLGSSGSVLPLFQSQIAKGGPVTVTHPEVTRFFMTIEEASRLVLLAGAFAKGQDVFVLDMGKPQKIIDIARRMIRLSGNRPREAGQSEGNIDIQLVGLRPGEKLYEELLIDDQTLLATPHEKIFRAEEHSLSEFEVAAMMRDLETAIAESDPERIRAQIVRRVDGYKQPVVARDIV